MLKLKLQYFGHLMWRVDSLEKTLMMGGIGMMAGWHHQLDGQESGWTLGAGDGQGGLACCNSWGCKESDTTEWLNWTELNWMLLTRSLGSGAVRWRLARPGKSNPGCRANLELPENQGQHGREAWEVWKFPSQVAVSHPTGTLSTGGNLDLNFRIYLRRF